MPQIKAWMGQTFPQWIEQAANKKIQSALFNIWQEQSSDSGPAQRIMRCYISYQVRLACQQLAGQVGNSYGFNKI